MTGAPLVVLDACVLANFSLCDTLLRLAEPPRLFEPKWSDEIIRETTRTLESRLGWPNSLTAHLEKELRVHFSEAWISSSNAQRRLAALTPQEAASPACYEASDLKLPDAMRGQIRSGTGSITCLPLVQTNPDYYDRTLPRTVVQLITVNSVKRCAEFRRGSLVSTSKNTYAGGCLVHAKMWQELNWQKMAELVVR